MPRIMRSATVREEAIAPAGTAIMLRHLPKRAIDAPPEPRARGPGSSFPLGATLSDGGANFSVFAKFSNGAQLLLFDAVDDPEPSCVIDLDQYENRTYHYWHVFVPGVTAGPILGYRVAGALAPAIRLRVGPPQVLVRAFVQGI